ncbi:hypothetical protein [Effusibacillus consociatus]|uniref:N-acetyltransferase domain-containing protein n=1 Tax=Effusibacillus consociatus TaxID=1117041 RepID=A0ABV9Q0U5_9BACL
MMSIITQHPELRVRSFLLATEDAHILYEKYGFKYIDDLKRYMRLYRPELGPKN